MRSLPGSAEGADESAPVERMLRDVLYECSNGMLVLLEQEQNTHPSQNRGRAGHPKSMDA